MCLVTVSSCLGVVYSREFIYVWGSRDASLVYFGIIKSQILVVSSVYFNAFHCV